MKKVIIFLIFLFSLPALSCNFIVGPDTDATATAVSAEIFATMTAMVPSATFTQPPTDTPLPTSTPTITPTDTQIPSPTITNTPEPTFTPEPTKPDNPTFGPITFHTEEDYNQDNLDNPVTEFPTGTTKVYACFDYWAMTPTTRVSDYWYANGEEWNSFSENWDKGDEGTMCWYIYYSDKLAGLENGDWKLKIFIGSDLEQEAEFYIGD
jgi:hypothetical protein